MKIINLYGQGILACIVGILAIISPIIPKIFVLVGSVFVVGLFILYPILFEYHRGEENGK